MLQEIIQRKSTGKKTKTIVKVDEFTFAIESYCYQKVGMTENMKFRLKCKENPAYNREFDDVKEMTEYIGQFIFTCVIDQLV